MLLADVAGHGETVSGVAADLRRLMRRYINTIRPHKLFEELNAGFAEIPSEGRFATSIVNSYFSSTSTLSICNAGHPPPLLFSSGTGEWQPLDVEHRADDMPFGVADTCEYTQVDIPMQVGDLVFCYTDGVIESPGSDGDQLGTSGLQRILSSLPPDRPERVLPELVEQIANRTGGSLHKDDVTMLLYRITNSPVRMRDNFAAPLRWLRGLLVRE
jgi:serine phosphatase RsbU (regulator of sigma subunit)